MSELSIEMSAAGPALRQSAGNTGAKQEGLEVSEACGSILSDEIERILMASERRQAKLAECSSVFEGQASIAVRSSTNPTNSKMPPNMNLECDGGPLTAAEITQLGMFSICPSRNSESESKRAQEEESTANSWGAVDGDNLVALGSMLEAHVNSAAHVDLIRETHSLIEANSDLPACTAAEQWIQSSKLRGDGSRRFAILRSGLEAASILISIMTTPGVDRRIISEDAIEACIALLRHHLYKHIFPSLSQTGHLPSAESNANPTHHSRATKRQKVAQPTHATPHRQHSTQQLQAAMKKIYKHVLSTIGLLSILIEHTQALLHIVQLDDRPLLSITSAALDTLAIEPAPTPQTNMAFCHLIQISALQLVAKVFKRYSRHRSIIVEDLFPLMLKLPTSKKSMRTFPVSNAIVIQKDKTQGQPTVLASTQKTTSSKSSLSNNPSKCQTHIQCVSALILALIQSCVIMPLPIENNEPPQQTQSTNLLPKLSSGLSECRTVCDLFATHMLQRCRTGTSVKEFKPILLNLVDDLLSVQLQPEYPSAEMLLLALCRRLSNDLLRCSSSNAEGNKSNLNLFEPTYLSLAMDTIGKICASVAEHLRFHRELPLKLPQAIDVNNVDSTAAPVTNAKEVIRCFCGRVGIIDTFMLDCDRCHAWFHGGCVGITKDNLPQVWMCDECTMQVMVMEQTKQFAERSCKKKNSKKKLNDQGEGNLPLIDETHIFRQLLLNHLSLLTETKGASELKTAEYFHLAKWIEEHENKRWNENDNKASKESSFGAEFFCAHFLEQWNLSQSDDDNTVSSPNGGETHAASSISHTNPMRERLSKEGNAKLIMALAATTSDLSKSFPRFLGVLLMLMGDDNISLRKLSVKAIGQVVKVDPTIMVQPTVRKAVARRFLDEAISVREAAVSLVGSYMLQDPSVADAFHSSLLARLSDKGVSVRKRCVRIFRDLLLSRYNYRWRASACTKMLQRAADPKEDDGVRDSIYNTFRDLWFDTKTYRGMTEDVKALMNANHMSSSVKKEIIENGQGIPMPQSVISDNNSSMISTGVASSNNLPQCMGTNKPSARKKKSDATLAAERQRLQCHASAMQMVEVVALSGNSNFLTTLVKDMLYGLGENEKSSRTKECAKRREYIKSHCTFLVSALMEELLALEDERSRFNGERKKEECLQLVALISTLCVFGESSPDLLQQHLETILPYLKGGNGVSKEDESLIVCSVSRILSRVVPLLSKTDIHNMSESGVCDDLERITYNFGSTALSDAVEALANLAGHNDVEDGCYPRLMLMKLATTFYGYLYKMKDTADDFSKVKQGVKSNIHRSLSVLGAICSQQVKNEACSSALDETTDIDPTKCPVLKPSSLTTRNLSNACFAIFSSYLEKRDVTTRCAALRAMSGIFMARPRVLLAIEHTGIVEEVMSTRSPPQLQVESLRCWRDILLTEEKRIESGEAKKQMDTKTDITLSKRISGDQDGDANLVGGVLTQHSQRLFQMTTSTSPNVRLATVELIGHLLRQGLINPMETVPHLLALQGDVENPEIRLLALKLLIGEGEKRPDMLRQRVCAGVQRAYLFQRIVNHSSTLVTAVIKQDVEKGDGNYEKEVECIFGPVFKESIANSRVQRQGLFKSMLSLFDSAGVAAIDDSNKNGINPRKKRKKSMEQLHVGSVRGKLSFLQRIPLLSYAAQILAHLPYETYLDPLFIIYHISCATEVQGAHLLDRFVDFLSSHKLVDNDDDNTMEDELERSVDANDRFEKMDAVFNGKKFDLERFCEMCAEAAALTLLLRLRMFLKKVYALSDAKCIEYNPSNQKERISDKTISHPERMPVFNNKIESFLKKSEMEPMDGKKGKSNIERDNYDKGAIIRQYAEFRQLMRTGDIEIKKLVLQSGEMKYNEDCLKRRKRHPGLSQKTDDKKQKKRKLDDDDDDYEE